jgi:hypothetical protein
VKGQNYRHPSLPARGENRRGDLKKGIVDVDELRLLLAKKS